MLVGLAEELGQGMCSLRPSDQVTLTYERLEATEVVTLNGIPCTNVARATFDAMRQADDDREAVVELDMMAAAERISIMRMAAYPAAHGGWQRTGRVLRAVDLASEHSLSPNETRLRLIWVLDAGLSRDVLVNCPVHDRTGALLGIADLLDPAAGLAVEFDGAEHRGAGRRAGASMSSGSIGSSGTWPRTKPSADADSRSPGSPGRTCSTRHSSSSDSCPRGHVRASCPSQHGGGWPGRPASCSRTGCARAKNWPGFERSWTHSPSFPMKNCTASDSARPDPR